MKFLDLIFASRPLLHLPIWSIYLVSFSTFKEDRDLSVEEVLIMLSISLIAAGAYYLNQIYDYETDLINNKLGFLQKELLTKKVLYFAAAICFHSGIFVAYNISAFHFFLLIYLITFSLLYSMPVFKFKDRPVLGLLSNGIAFGYLIPYAIVIDVKTELLPFIKSNLPLYFFLTVSAIHIMTTVCDIDGDKKTNKKTVATKLGIKNSILSALVLLIASCLIAYSSETYSLLIVSAVSSLVLIVSFIISTPAIINFATKLPILLLTLLAGYYQPIYLIFIVVLIIANRIYFKKRFKIVYPKLN